MIGSFDRLGYERHRKRFRAAAFAVGRFQCGLGPLTLRGFFLGGRFGATAFAVDRVQRALRALALGRILGGRA